MHFLPSREKPAGRWSEAIDVVARSAARENRRDELWWGRSETKTRRDGSREAVAGEPAQYTNPGARTLSADRGRHRRSTPRRPPLAPRGPRLISQFSQRYPGRSSSSFPTASSLFQTSTSREQPRYPASIPLSPDLTEDPAYNHSSRISGPLHNNGEFGVSPLACLRRTCPESGAA